MKGSNRTPRALANAERRRALRMCAVAGCERRLRADNESGVCAAHKRRKKRCVRCGHRISTRSTRCASCLTKERREAAKRQACAGGCGRETRSASSLCRACWLTDRPCVVDGCGGKVAAWSESGYCQECRRRGYAPRRATDGELG